MTKSSTLCVTCKKPKASFSCDLCSEPTCKSCAHFLGEESFSFLRVIPEELKKTTFCLNCFNEKISAQLTSYEETMEAAKEIILFFKNQGRLTRFIKRSEDPYKVDNCEDRDEAIMKMSFYAIQDKFNALVDVDVNSKKVTIGTYKKLVWTASAVPALIDPDSINSDCFRGV